MLSLLLMLPFKPAPRKKVDKPEIEYDKIPEADLVVKHVNLRRKKGLGTNVYVIGLSGTGKSSVSQRLGEVINESNENSFRVFITSSLIEFIRAVRTSKHGDIVIIEEVSVLFPSRRAMSQDNVAIGAVFDTVRKKKLCVISNCPIWSSVDSHMRALGHILIETLSVKKKAEVVISKFHRLQTAPSTGKTYRHTFTREGRDIQLMYTRMPDKEKWAEYESLKDKFMDDLYNKLELKQKKKIEKEKEELGISKPIRITKLTKRELEVHELVNIKGMNQSQAAGSLGVDPSRISRILQNITKKTQISTENEQNDSKSNDKEVLN